MSTLARVTGSSCVCLSCCASLAKWRGLGEPTEMTQGGRNANRDWMLGDPCQSPPACCLARPVGAGKPRRINRRDDVVLGQWMPLASPEMVCRLSTAAGAASRTNNVEAGPKGGLFSRTLSQVNRTANYAASVDYDMTPFGRVHRRSRHPSRLALRTSPIFFVSPVGMSHSCGA